ncbi:hypothetical protein LTR74_005135 [Friedmanniomyces endolithicus]|nr:hypothetical protein LTR74_005135 [Friedmanniomyces endolithicus]
MFGIIISGRPVDAAPQIVAQTQYAFRVSPAPAFSHIVVFLLPGSELPPDVAASVYLQIPPSSDFRLLGAIGPGKESAIFKVNGIKPHASTGDTDTMTEYTSTSANGIAGDIVVGISIEPAAQVEAQLAQMKAGQQTSTALVSMHSGTGSRIPTKVLAQRIIGNAFNFLASFGSDVVPLKAFQDWWVKFEKKVELDPSFLEREEQGAYQESSGLFCEAGKRMDGFKEPTRSHRRRRFTRCIPHAKRERTDQHRTTAVWDALEAPQARELMSNDAIHVADVSARYGETREI